MADPRIQEYAKLLVERCVNVQPGWQVRVSSSPLARPLVEEVIRCIARRGAYAMTRLSYGNFGSIWMKEVPESTLEHVADITKYEMEHLDADIQIAAPENTREGSDIPQERLQKWGRTTHPLGKRLMSFDLKWVACQFPTPALAQEADMSLSAFEDFLYGACLLDWDEEGRKMRRIADRFDQADQVRIVGEGTDLTLSIKGRPAIIDDGHANMPGGEFFYSPIEDSAEGVIHYAEFPAVYMGQEVVGARLVFRQGKVVEATADKGEAFLLKVLDADPGARFLGELGIGCNPGITRHMKNTLFDEKIYGTIHLAVGRGFPFAGGKNESQIHWDMVKDLRQGGRIYLDGELVQENGQWKI